MDYHIVTAKSIPGLVQRVKLAIEQGWEPVGGFIYVPASEFCVECFGQALIKEVR